MANTDKNIIVTPNIGSSTDDPKIQFNGGNSNVATEVTLRVYPTYGGTLSFEGSAGQLFSITNDLTGSIFSVNDVSGIPSIDVNADGTLLLAPYNGSIGIGTASASSVHKLHVYGGNIDIGTTGYGLVFPDNTLQTTALRSGVATPASYTGGISAITVDTFGRITSVTGSAGYTTNTGTVTTLSVVSANGFAGTVATATTTPAITLTTTITGVLKGNGTAISAAAAADLNSAYGSQTANQFLAAPNGTAGNPGFRAIVAADIPTLNQNTTGYAAGIAGGSVGQLHYQTGTNTTGFVGVGTSGWVLTGAGTSVPTWTQATNANTANTIVQRDASGNFTAGTITATLSGNATNVTGVVATANGGTGLSGASPFTSGGVLYASSASALASSGTLTANGIVLGGGAGGAPTSTALGAANTVVTGTGAAPAFSSTPTLTSITLNGASGAKASFTGGTSNWIAWNANGVAAPSFTTSSAGTKLILYPNQSGSTVDFALGIEPNTLWFSTFSTFGQFKWYGGTSQAMLLSGTGDLDVTSTVTGTAFIPDGSTVPANGLYLPATNTLGFATASSQAMQIDQFNNVSINTSTVGYPAAGRTSLTINATTEPLLGFYTGGTTTRGFLYYSNAGEFMLGSQTGPLVLRTVNTGTPQPIVFQTSGGIERMRLDSNGNVGIGTNSPLTLLVVGSLGSSASDSTYGGLIKINGGRDFTSPSTGVLGDGGLEFKSSVFTNGFGWLISAPDRQSSNVPLSFAYRNNSATWTELVTMRSDTGRVGIGTTTPGTLLDVAGMIRMNSATQFNGITLQNGTYEFAKIYGQSATNDNGILGLNFAGVNYITLRASGVSYINGGDVGIGSTIPAYKLDVVGTGRFTGALTLNTALAIASGGTNSTAIPTNGGVSYGTGSAFAFTAAGTQNQALISNGAAAPSWVTLDLTYLPDAAFKKSVKAATTANIALSGTQTLDGVAVAAGDRVLVKDQTTASQNGIYVVAAGAWTRAADADTVNEIAGATVNVDQGTAWGSVLFSNDFKTTSTLNTTAMNWSFLINNNSTQTLTNKTLSTSSTWNGNTIGTAYGGTGLSGASPFTSGGVLYASSASALASSGVLAASSLVVGGGAGAAPSTITTGTGVVTALGVAVGSSGAFVTNGGALGTPASGNFSTGTFTWPTFNQNTTGYAAGIAGGSVGQLHYQTGTNTTGFVGIGTVGYVLSGNGAAIPVWTQFTNANTASTIVQRDASGNFSAGTITATLSGSATSAGSATTSTTQAITDDSTNIATTAWVNKSLYSQRGAAMAHGGGTVTYSGGSVLWSARFIIIANSKGTSTPTGNVTYYDINCPTSGSIDVVGTTAVTATASGIPIGIWQALYYDLGAGFAAGASAFHIVAYNVGTANYTIPSSWVWICGINGDTVNKAKFVNGLTLLPGQSFDCNAYSSYLAPTAATATTATTANALNTANDYQVNSITAGGGLRLGTNSSLVANTANSTSQLIVKKVNQSMFSVLSWDSTVFFGYNAYYNNSVWTHSAPSGDNNNALFALNSGGAAWYASNNGSASWNVASGLSLWNQSGQWAGAVNGTTIAGTSGTFSSSATATAFIPSGATIPTNGMYLPATNTLGFATASTPRMVLTTTGNVGIGQTTASYNLDVLGKAAFSNVVGVAGAPLGQSAFSWSGTNTLSSQDGNGLCNIVANGYQPVGGGGYVYSTGTRGSSRIALTDSSWTIYSGNISAGGTSGATIGWVPQIASSYNATVASSCYTWISPRGLFSDFYMDINGNVGINNSVPGYKLDVTGTGHFTSTLTLDTALAAGSGGTGQSSYTIGDILYASASNALSKLAGVATGNSLISGGVGVAPSWGKIGLTTHVSGTLGISNGGTNSTATPTNGGVSYGTGTAYAFTAAGSQNQALISNGAAAPSWVTLDLSYLPDAAFKKSVKAATTANIALSGTQTLDGVAVAAGDRVLVKDQTTASQNGIYVVAAGAWTRAADADTISEIAGGTVNVDQGTAWGSVLFSNNLKTTDTLGTTAMNWSFLINNDSTQTLTNKTLSTSSTWNGNLIGIAYGGTGANLTASNGGILYSTATAFAVLAGTATAGQMLRSGASGAPSWSTATFPSTTTANQLLYSSAANTIAGLTSANTAALVTNNTGVPAFTAGTTANRVLRTDGTTISFAQVALGTDVSGQLGVGNGGTGLTTGTSGGVLYFSAAGTLASSAALAASSLVVGGGAGVAPSTITTGTGVVTALGVNTGTAGAFVVNGGALGTPSSGTLTNCTFPTLNQNTTGSAGSVTNALTINNGGAGAASGTTYNGSAAVTISHNSIGAVPTGRTIGIVQGTGVTVTTSGSLDLTANRSWTIAIGQDVATTASPTFNQINYTTLNGQAANTRDKVRVWNSNVYAIGMTSPFTFGAINNDYAMTFQMSDTTTRGFWWGDAGHTSAQGAMALSTDGKLTVAHSIRVGYGESDVTVPGATHDLDVSGTGYFTGNITVNGGNGTGHGLILSDDGDIVDNNDGYASMRFTSGVRVYSTKGGGTVAITLASSGAITAGSLALTTDLPISEGGTGASTAATALSNLGGVPTSRTIGIVQGTGVTVTTSGSLDLTANRSWTIAIGQDVSTSASPTFVGLTLTGLLAGRTAAVANVSVSNDTGSFSARGSTTAPAVMSFHRAGAYAINMGLDTDNVFKIGGWSDGVNAYRMQLQAPGGTHTFNGTVAATTFSGAGTSLTGTAASLTAGSAGVDNANNTFNCRVIGNYNSTANNDGMYIGYANSNSGPTRIYGGGATTAPMVKYSDRTEEAGSFRAPIFYDTNNTAYYTDPAATSVLSRVSLWSGTTSALHVNDVAGASSFNFIMSAANDTGTKLVAFVNGSTRSADGGVNGVTIRNDGGPFVLGSTSQITTVAGSYVGIPTDLIISGGVDAIQFNNATSNYISWNTAGVAAPAFTTRSAGTKLVLFPSIGAAAVDYALGIENNNLWFSTTTTSSSFKWYGGTTTAMTLTGAGSATATADFRAPIFYDSDNTAYYLNPLGGFTFAAGTSNRVSFVGSDAGLQVTGAEGTTGEVRLGAAWNLPGLYTAASLALQAGSGDINFRVANVTYGTLNSDYLTHTSDIRTPIFYDSNDTAVRWDAGIFVLRSGSPTIYFRDTDANSAMLHNNSNLLYVLRGANDTETWTQVNSQWPVTINLTNNDCTIGGSLSAVGNVSAYASDRRLKENIKEIPKAIEKIKQIRGVTFDWNDLSEQQGFIPDRKYDDVGVIAQEIQQVLPNVVTLAPFDTWNPDPGVKYTNEELAAKTGTSKSGENYLTVQYEKIVPLLIQAIKEQQVQIEELKTIIERK